MKHKDAQPQAKVPTAEPAKAASPAPAQAEAAVSRRSLFGGAGVGVSGVVAYLAAACSTSDFAGNNSKIAPGKSTGQPGGDGTNGQRKATGASGGPDGTGTNGKNGTGTNGAGGGGGGTGTDGMNGSGGGTSTSTSGTTDPACLANHADALKLDAPVASGDLVPTVVFYGTPSSALVAIHFKAGQDVKQVVLVGPNGAPIALHGITGADQRSDGSFRPIVIDNVSLREAGADLTQLKILIQQAAGQALYTATIAYFTSYNGKPVLDLSGHTVPAGFAGNQSVAKFDAPPTAFRVDTSVTYPNKYNSAGPRNLQTVVSTTSWTPDTSVVKGITTDIMGNTIAIGGAALLEYQVFCTYVDTGTHFARTILHLG